jgi:hypothetical protein
MFTILIFIHYNYKHTSELIAERVKLIQTKLVSFVQVELNLYEFISFNININYYGHNRLIYFTI